MSTLVDRFENVSLADIAEVKAVKESYPDAEAEFPIWLSAYTVPKDPKSLNDAGLPFGFIASPATVTSPLQLEKLPLRCRRCKAALNRFCTVNSQTGGIFCVVFDLLIIDSLRFLELFVVPW